MIPSDLGETAYVADDTDDIVFRPIIFSNESNAPQRPPRRTSVPINGQSTPAATSYYRRR